MRHLLLAAPLLLAATASAEVVPAPTPAQRDAANQAVVDADQGGLIYPVAANVANVWAYGATPDDDTDDTAAFQAALDAQPRNQLLYVPNGTYLISDTLRWAGTSRGNAQKRQSLQGQSRDGVILHLPDQSAGFQDPDEPRAMIWTGSAPAQRFMNHIRDLTVDTGVGNPGAIGIRFYGNNQAGMSRVTIRTSDPDRVGVIGLDLGHSDEQGPLLLEDISVEGFDTGIYTNHAVNSVTADGIMLRDQLEVGWHNRGQCVSVRDLVSSQPADVVPYSNAGPGLTAMIDSRLHSLAVDEAVVAFTNDAFATYMLREVLFENYHLTTSIRRGNADRPTPRPANLGPRLYGTRVTQQDDHTHVVLTATSVLNLFEDDRQRPLNLPVAAFPEVPIDPPDQWTSVADFGPPETIELTIDESGETVIRQDWTAAIQRAIDSGVTTLYFPRGDYGFYGDVHVRGAVRRITGLRNSFPRTVSNTRHDSMFREDVMPRFIIDNAADDDPDAAVVIEDFGSHYFLAHVVQQSNRPVHVRHMSIHSLFTTPAPGRELGDAFLSDIRGRHVDANGGRVFARQLNTEGHVEPRNQARDGGSLWVLGLKTENDATVAHAMDGGSIEIVGGFIYANKATDPDKTMFRIDEGGALSATVGEWVTRRNQPFHIAEQTRGGETRRIEHGDPGVPGRGHGSAVPLLIARPAD